MRAATILAALIMSSLAPGAGTCHASDDEIDLDEIVRRPTIGNYRGYAEFKMGRYDSAKRIWEALDARKFGEAAFNLGILYEDGLGVPRDIGRALAYYRRGSDHGSPKASFRLGSLYWHGAPGVVRDPVAGRRFLAIAAAEGDAEAIRLLAGTAGDDDLLAEADRAFAEGRPEAAVGRLREAAERGLAAAQTRLAWSYEAGRGVGRDLARAAEWFARAAQAGDGEAMYALAVMHATGAGRPRDPAAADDWLRRSAAAGHPAAVADLGRRQPGEPGQRSD